MVSRRKTPVRVLVPEELVDGLARPVAVVQPAVSDLPDGVSLARIADDRTDLYLVDGHRQSVAQKVDALGRTSGSTTAAAVTAVGTPRQLGR